METSGAVSQNLAQFVQNLGSGFTETAYADLSYLVCSVQTCDSLCADSCRLVQRFLFNIWRELVCSQTSDKKHCPLSAQQQPPLPPPSTRPRHRPHFGPLSEACRTQTPFRSLFLGRRTLTPFRSRRWPEGYVVGSPFLANALLWGYLRNVRTQMRMPPMMFSILTL